MLGGVGIDDEGTGRATLPHQRRGDLAGAAAHIEDPRLLHRQPLDGPAVAAQVEPLLYPVDETRLVLGVGAREGVVGRRVDLGQAVQRDGMNREALAVPAEVVRESLGGRPVLHVGRRRPPLLERNAADAAGGEGFGAQGSSRRRNVSA